MDVIEKAKSRREALLKEIRRLDEESRRLHDWITTAEALDAELQPVVAAIGSVAALTANIKPPPPLKKLSNRARVLAAVSDLIKTNGPMKKRDIFSRLEEMGINPGTSTPSVMLSIFLSKSELFSVDKKKGVWQFAKGRSPSGVNH